MLFEVTADRIRDFAAYIVIGVVFCGTCLWFAVHDIDVKWFSLLFETCLVFGCTIGMSRRLWRRLTFWVCLIVLIGVHFAAFGIVLRHIQQWRAPEVSVAFVIETSVALTICQTAMSRVELRKRKARHPQAS